MKFFLTIVILGFHSAGVMADSTVPSQLATGGIFANLYGATDGQYVYWSEAQYLAPKSFNAPGIYRVPVTGGTPELIAVATNPEKVQVVGDRVFFSGLDGYVAYVSKTGGTPTKLGLASSESLFVAGDRVYWTPDSSSIVETLIGSGKTRTLSTGYQDVQSIVKLGHKLFWTDFQSGIVWYQSLDSRSAPSFIYQKRGVAPDEISTDGKNLYWANKDENSVMIYEGNTGNVRPLYLGKSNDGDTLEMTYSPVSDGEYVYFGEINVLEDNKDSIVRVPIAGGSVSILASGLCGASGLALDRKHVYWQGCDAVYSLERE